MRRFPLAFAAIALGAALFAGCGPSPRELEPGLREVLRDLAKAVVANDKDKIAMYFLPASGFINDPVGAKSVDTPEGRASANEANRRWVRRLFKDSGIEKDTDVDVCSRRCAPRSNAGLNSDPSLPTVPLTLLQVIGGWLRSRPADLTSPLAPGLCLRLSRRDNRP